MTDTVKKVSITLDYEVQNLYTLFQAAKNALEELRAKTIAEHGESEDRRYAQPLDQLIQTELHDTATGEPPRLYRRPFSSSQATLSSMFMFA